MATVDFTLEDVVTVVNTAVDRAKFEIIDTVHRIVHEAVNDSKREIINMVTEDFAAEGKRIDSLGGKITKLGKRIGSLEGKVDRLETRVGGLDTRVDRLDTKVDSLDNAVRAHISDPWAHSRNQKTQA